MYAVGNMKTPGPNAYDQNKFRSVKKSAPAFSLRSRYLLAKGDTVPGPGTYEQNSPPKKRSASYVFGTSEQRESIKNEKSPGPQTYHVPCSIALMP